MPRVQPLWETTRDLHHACEQHPVGASMSNGTVSEQVWCDWLGVLHVIHSVIDRWLPPDVHVTGNLTLDLIDMLPMEPRRIGSAILFANKLLDPLSVGGAAYVLVGAHRRGGQMMERTFAKAGRTLPNRHVRFSDPAAAEAFVKELRLKGELSTAARATFRCLLDCMDEISSFDRSVSTGAGV